ncbi:MAG TPA: adenine deaminase C-terminal domain-containing protein, partial [Anaerolineae bacterium]
MHIESSHVTPGGFAQAVLPHGTTTILADPHEVANVAGEEGVRWMIRASEGLPLRILYAIPSCVPATSPDLEWTAAVFDAGIVTRLAQEPSVIALGEVMDYGQVLSDGARLRGMVDAAHQAGLLVEGHIPTLHGIELSQYLAWRITSDHTLTTPDKIREQISKGLAVMIQAKSCTAENMAAVQALPDRSRVLLVTDDIEPSLLIRGHLSLIVRRAVEAGLPPLEAIASASIRPARYLGLRDLGGIAPGFSADFSILDDLAACSPSEVFARGELVASNGKIVVQNLPRTPSVPACHAVPGPFVPQDFRVPSNGQTRVTANAVVVKSDVNTFTDLARVPVASAQGYITLDEDRSLAFVAVVARDQSSKAIGIVQNLGLRAGAVASSFAHDSHNLLVVGREVTEMAAAANAVHEMGGGVAVVRDGAIMAKLPLPVLGLLSDFPLDEITHDFGAVENALRELGVRHTRPFLMLSLLSLSVSPKFKFTDKGVIDTERRQLLPTWE